jgi:hypothetical protein
MALTFTAADLVALKAALISGARRVRIGDREVEYQSREEIIATIQMIQQVIDGSNTADSQNIKASYSKGE